jgi:flagellar biosynthesis protein FlhA
MITHFYPNIYVLAFNEITSDVQIQALGNITLEGSARTERKAVGT